MSLAAPEDPQTAACLEALRQTRDADTLPALFRSRAARLGEAPFLLFRDRCLSWQQVGALATAWAGELRRQAAAVSDDVDDAGGGIAARVAVALPNCDSLVVLLLACAKAGLVFVPVNPALTAEEMATALGVVSPTLIVTTAGLVPKLSAAAAQAGCGPLPVVAVDDADLTLPDLPDPVPERAGPDEEPDPGQPLAIVFTSGTTGVPKGAVHSHRTYVTAAEIAAFRMRLDAADRLLVILPLFHLNALFYSVGGTIVCGGRLVIEERFQAGGFWQVVARHGITQVNMIAAVGNILLKRDRSEFPGNATLRKVSAAPVTREVADALRDSFGIAHVVESYGMTEAPGIAQVDFFDRDHRACLGRPIVHPLTNAPVSQIRIVDEARRDLPAGEVGRIMIRASTMMQGYFRRPDLADRIDGEGWFLTEDRGRLDPDGYAYFCGRTADLIRTRGENVAAAEVEAAILTHSAVSEVGCIGIPSDMGEEDILAVVALRPGAQVLPAELAAHCRARLSRHKVPRLFVFRDALPKTPTQKVAHHRLRADPDLLADAVPVEPAVVS
ncbi:class I adenylate-forming enzyme family protein [Marinibaculum pumilum]|uniref:Class I adenylate-forming enzyme family protein n=1 Tax=Marinibaculum pumilum TaxID=1766165 RepID=A0ABV7KZE4_9PROT